jgi:asparagine synthase (glutamine-hydrolysing)
MCGIAGILNVAAAGPVDESLIRRMVAMIRHRGPDQFGIYLDDAVALGNARLSILDPESGQQPIANEDESLWIVLNGEIFNYPELRADLEARGHRLSTQTDTEVVLHLYEDLGPACLRQLNGQFAMAIWNARDQSLCLARDRFGICPLFYAQTEGALVFGSEVKALACHPAIQLRLDPLALAQVFTYWSPLTPRSVFRDIKEIPPGRYLMARGGRVTLETYWEMHFESARETSAEDGAVRTEAELVDELGDLLVDAVRIRLRADVPVGAYLSGGLDSSMIASVAQRVGAARLDTFSVSFSDAAFDESPYQRSMAAHLGTAHQVTFVSSADIARVFPDVVWHTETPVLRTAPAPMFLLSRLVRQSGYKVVLTGEGADEFLAGYDIFKEAKVRRFWARQPGSTWRPRLLQRLYGDIARYSSTGPEFLSAFFGYRLSDVEAPGYSHAIRWRNTGRTLRFFSDELVGEIAAARTTESGEVQYPGGFDSWDPLARSQYLEAAIFLPSYLLSSQGDRMMMAHSVEGRFPFLDHRLVEFCNRLPPRFKLRGLRDKYLLRKLGQAWLPRDIARRPKRPYRAPIHRCFARSTAPDYVQDLLSPASLKAAGLFNPAAVGRLLQKLDSGSSLGETEDMAVAGVVSGQLVHQQFVAGLRDASPLGGRDDVKVCRQPPLGTS